MQEHCKVCGVKCSQAIAPTVRGWKFYKAFIAVILLPLSGFILGVYFGVKYWGDILGFFIGCGTCAVAFIPAICIDKQGEK